MLKANDIRQLWNVHRIIILRIAITIMAIAALVWLGYEFWRLLFQPGYWGAIDLRILRGQSTKWLGGINTYTESQGATYPPMSYLLLGLSLSLDFTSARWMWAVMIVAGLIAMIYLSVKASGTSIRLEQVLVGLLPLAMYSPGAAIGNGQLIPMLLPILVIGILWLSEQPNWRKELAAIGMILISLSKPTISAPFFWLVIFVPRNVRPAFLTSIAYAMLTLYALSFQQADWLTLWQAWLQGNSQAAITNGVANLSTWLASSGFKEWILPTALIVLAALGIWVWRHQQTDIWILLGVTAIVARIWAYHSWYDDVLILLPMIALYRVAKNAGMMGNCDVIAGVLFALLLLFSLAPGGLYLFPEPLATIYVTAQVILWLVVLLFLARETGHQSNYKLATESQ
jgi:hypothetical protein